MSRGQSANGPPARLRRGDVPRQLWPPGPELHRRDHAVRPDDDGQCRVADESLQGGAPLVAGEPDVRPASLDVRAGLSLVPGPGGAADPDQQKAVPAAEVRQFSVGLPRGQHSRASGQDRVQPDRRPITGVHERVEDQAAGPQRGRGAGREEAPRGVLQGAGFEPWCRGGGDGLADGVAADGGGQRDPADGGAPVLAPGHGPADHDGLFDHDPRVRAPFGVIAGQQVLPGLAGEHVRDLPGEVVGVAQPGGQALADERRGEVGGIAEQEDAPGLEAGRHPGTEGVGRAADDLHAAQVAAPGPGSEQFAERLRGDQAGFVLAVPQLKLPAVPVAGDLHEGGGPGGVADLLHAIPRVKAGIGPYVDDQPSFGKPQVFHGDPGQLP
jgi:hypothetical protein